MNTEASTFVVLCLLTSSVVYSGDLRIERSPCRFVVSSPREQRAEVDLVAIDALRKVTLNGVRLAKTMPTQSVLSLRPDGTAVFTYADLFLRNFRGRRQRLATKDGGREPREGFLNFPGNAKPPKFLLDLWKVNATQLFMNAREDILWWTGDLVYRFDFAFPVVSFKLESPDGRRTMVGDWEWKKVGRAVKIFASIDSQHWTLIWQSHGKGGRTPIDAELPTDMRGAQTVFIKFRGQNANVLFDLFVTARLDARSGLAVLTLKKGDNPFVFEDAPDSSHRALVAWQGEGVRLLAQDRKFAYPSKTRRVVAKAGQLVVLFPEKVGVWLSVEKGIVKGIERIVVGQREVLAPLAEGGRAPVASVVAGGRIEPVEDWAAYLREREKKFGNGGRFPKRGGLKIEKVAIEGRFVGWREDGPWVCVTSRLESGATAEWLFAPTSEKIGGGTYSGLKWKLRLTGFGKVHEIAVEEPVTLTVGDWRLAQVWGPFEEHQLGLSGEFHMPERGYFARQQPFFFLAGEDGSTVSFFNSVVHAMVSETRDVDRIVVRTRIPVRADKVIETPQKVWLFRKGDFSSKWDALNEWTWVFDSLAERYRAMKGIAPVEPRPTLLWQSAQNAKLWGRDYLGAAKGGLPQEKRWFYRLASEIPKLARWGVRVIYVSGALESDADKTKADRLPGSICFGSVCAPWRVEVSPCMGGVDGLKHLCDAAHRHGVRIVLWSTPAHLSNSSPLLREHPDWLAWKADGTPEHFGYRDITGVSLHRGYFDYAMRQYEKIRRATGFDGLWQDSFLTFGILTDFRESTPYPQLDETVEMQRRLQAMGCTEIHIEGCGPLGLSSGGCGYGRPVFFSRIEGKEYGLYNYMADTSVEPQSYFRALASKGVVGIKSIVDFEELPSDVRKRIVKFNRAYLEALPFMKRRRLLGRDEKWLGVEWFDQSGRGTVLFTFEPLEYEVHEIAPVRDLIDARQVAVEYGRLRTEPWHVYVWR